MLKEYRDLARKVSTSQVVGLGEALHGSPELHLALTSVARELIEKYGFRAVAIENPISITEHLGSARSIQKKNLYKIWQTSEFISFLSWLKEYNYDNPTAPVKLIGFDIRQPDIDLQQLIKSSNSRFSQVAKELNLYKNLEDWKHLELACYKGVKFETTKMRTDYEAFKKMRKHASKAKSNALAFDRILCWMEYCIQARQDYGRCLATRDTMMYRQLHKKLASERTILIGHSSHLFRRTMGEQSNQYDFVLKQMLGQLISKKFKTAYSMLHFTGNKITTYDTPTKKRGRISPKPNSVEHRLSQTNRSGGPIVANQNQLKNYLAKWTNSPDLSDFQLADVKNNPAPSSAFAFRTKTPNYLDYLICIRP